MALATIFRKHLYSVDISPCPLPDQEAKIQSWLIGCQQDHQESQKLLYREFYGYGMSICLRYADGRDAAAEILNDGFLKIFGNMKKFDLAMPFKPWLRKILINTAINYYHRQQRQIHTESIVEAKQQPEEETILSKISYQEIILLLQKLPPSYRAVFNLYVIEGYKHEEIASLLNITAGTSKSNLFKAKVLLKKILKDFFEEDYVATR